jgi:hypothetical protein
LVVLHNDLPTLHSLNLLFFLTLGPLNDCLDKLESGVVVVWIILKSRSSCVQLLLRKLGVFLVNYCVDHATHTLLDHLDHFLIVLTVQ